MKDCFDKGIAFVFEGDTEKYFYFELLKFLSSNHDWALREMENAECETLLLTNGNKEVLVRFNTVGTITQIVHSGNWFNNMCANKYSSKMPWEVFLCYDTDSHECDISKFQAGDWKILRNNIEKRSNICVVDMAASADIEDVFLQDLPSISRFLQLGKTLTEVDVPPGRKGKTRLRQLYRKYAPQGTVYHEGIRALPLIQALDMQTIIDSKILPLTEIENSIF